MSLIIRILTNKEKYIEINKIFNLTKNVNDINFWEIEVPENSIKIAYDILIEKIKLLERIDITKNDVSLWFLYEYENQCNMEFTTHEINLIGKLGITLCISCWEK